MTSSHDEGGEEGGKEASQQDLVKTQKHDTQPDAAAAASRPEEPLPRQRQPQPSVQITQDDDGARVGTILPESPRTDDEGYQESETSSLLSSIADEVKTGKIENGRKYAAFGAHEYGLPIDDDELDRLDMNHAKYFLLQGRKNYLAPLPPDPQRILDIGCGTGIWCIDIADEFPSASVIGTDLAPVQPQWIPPNCQFQIDDAEASWSHAPGSFDYVHLRDMYHGIRGWERLVAQCFTALKPGGLVEFSQVHPSPRADDGTMPRESAYLEMTRAWDEIGERLQCDPLSATRFKQWFLDQGFVDVKEYIFKIPCSPWAKDPTLKKIGAYELLNVLEGAKGFLLRGWTKEFGQTREELEMLIHRMRKELVCNKMHGYIPFYAVVGRKPWGPDGPP